MFEYKKNIKKNFKSSFKWNLFGSGFYESLKILHQIFLLKIMHSAAYGLQGSIFSIIYLTVYLTEFGMSNSITPFLNFFVKSKENFKKIFLFYYLTPQIIIFVIASIITTYFYSKSFLYKQNNPFIFLILLIIPFEGIRIFLRRLLHTLFLSKRVIITETVLVTFYVSTVWICYLFFNFKITQNLVFIPYLIDTFLGVSIFSFYVFNFYKKLNNKKLDYPENLLIRIIKTRFFNYSIQVGKNFFTGNFLTPFFASGFGLEKAGIFNLANHIAESIKSIMKVTFIFSGNALLARIKDSSLSVKRLAFNALSKNLSLIIYPIIIFVLINYKNLIKLKNMYFLTSNTILQSSIFSIIALLEYFFIIYEQFYIVEEKTARLFLFKIFEFALFYIFILLKNFANPILALISIFIVKVLSLLLISINAYILWKIKPDFRINSIYLFICTIISLLFYLIFQYIFLA
ncbi:hypothetical protein K9L05_02095 [Candidatus Babeliales bacterium]|nr:hypothetical protein [Candidatus Babeliales bacterium]MCF7899420.1 hypothetical protein [Candidatus Babeliales bacterium]